MKKNLKLAISLVSFLAVHASFALKTIDAQTPRCPGLEKDGTFNILTGPELLNNNSWTTVDQILAFLKNPKINSWLQGPKGDGNIRDVDGATIPFPQLVLNAAANPYSGDTPPVSLKPINPQLLVALVQSENGLLRKEDRPDDDALAHIVNCPTTPTTIAKQIQCAARTLRKWFDQLAACQPITPQTTWHLNRPNPTPTLDGVNVQPKNAASGAHFAYTNEVGTLWGGNKPKTGGSADFCRIWNGAPYISLDPPVFGSPPTTLTLSPTNPTLTCSDPQMGQGSIDQRNVTLSVSGGTPPYTWMVNWPTSTQGTLTTPPCGVNNEDTMLKPPANNGGFLGQVAFRRYSAHTTTTGAVVDCGGGAFAPACINTFAFLREFGCDDMALPAGWQQTGCFPFPPQDTCGGVVREFPCGGLCGSACAIPDANVCIASEANLNACPFAVCDKRNDAMIAGNCNPCVGVMSGATVTVTDNAKPPASITRPITVR